MQTDGLFRVATFRIRLPENSEPIKLIFFGDVHRDSPGHAEGAWQDFLDYARAQEHAYFVGMGDYLDSTSTSERACLGHITDEMHDTFLEDLNALQLAKCEKLAKELEFARGKIIGLISGNHFWKFPHGGTTDHKLCELLGCQYLGVSAFVRLVLTKGPSRHSAMRMFDLWLHHGAGGARLVGGSINRVEQMVGFADADAYVMGHDHKRGVLPASPRLYLQHSQNGGYEVKSRQQWLIRSGSFLASYQDGKRSYNVDAARGPCSLGHAELELTAHRPTGADGSRPMVLKVRGIT